MLRKNCVITDGDFTYSSGIFLSLGLSRTILLNVDRTDIFFSPVYLARLSGIVNFIECKTVCLQPILHVASVIVLGHTNPSSLVMRSNAELCLVYHLEDNS